MHAASIGLIVAAILIVALGAISRSRSGGSLAVDAGLTGPAGVTLFIGLGALTMVFLPTVGYVIAIGSSLVQVVGSVLVIAWLVVLVRWWRRLRRRRLEAM